MSWNHQTRANRLSRRTLLAAGGALAGAAVLGCGPVSGQHATPIASPIAANRDRNAERWVGTWSASPHAPGPGFEDIMPSQLFTFEDQTVRQIVRVSAGGERVRVRLSNTFGDTPLAIGAAHIAVRGDGEAIDPATDRALTFSGVPSITIPPGALVLSDPVDLAIPALAELAVSIHLPEPTTSDTVHGFAFQTNYVSPAGNFTAESVMPVETTMQTWVFLTGIDVAVAEPTRVVVALGDSITDGANSTPDANQRWPDLLANRLAEASDEGPVAVLNQGIGGNRLLADGVGDFAFAGPGALARLDRDVLAQPGVTHLIVFEGINDIGMAAMAGEGVPPVTADRLIVALRQIAERGHAAGLTVLGATITPFEGAMYFTPEGEQTRQAVNDWIRTGSAFDAVLDFDAILRDPDDPGRLLPAYDAGDALHPNDAGFATLAESIDLSLLRA